MKTQLAIMKNEFNKETFVIPQGNVGNNKPESGGFWTSTKIDENLSDWIDFATREGFYTDKELNSMNSFEFKVSDSARILTIDSKEDYTRTLNKYGVKDFSEKSILKNSPILSFELIMKDYDGMNLTRKGLSENKYPFFGWDCESTVWFNLDHLELM